MVEAQHDSGGLAAVGRAHWARHAAVAAERQTRTAWAAAAAAAAVAAQHAQEERLRGQEQAGERARGE